MPKRKGRGATDKCPECGAYAAEDTWDKRWTVDAVPPMVLSDDYQARKAALAKFSLGIETQMRIAACYIDRLTFYTKSHTHARQKQSELEKRRTGALTEQEKKEEYDSIRAGLLLSWEQERGRKASLDAQSQVAGCVKLHSRLKSIASEITHRCENFMDELLEELPYLQPDEPELQQEQNAVKAGVHTRRRRRGGDDSSTHSP